MKPDSIGASGQSSHPLLRPASHQSATAEDKMLHSGNAGFVVWRTAQFTYQHRRDGQLFASEMARFMNQADLNGASFLYFEEVCGRHDRVHFFINWKSPVDYALSLEMVDHDAAMIDLLESDRVEDENDKGDWAKAVVESTMRDRCLVPQHGGPEDHEEEHAPQETWVEPASHQVELPVEQQLTTASAPLVVHRVAQAKHRLRNEARAFAFAWQNHINRTFPGAVTSYLYEETFGRMDHLHWLIHLRSFEDWERVRRLAEHDKEYADLFERPWVPKSKGGGGWGQAFVDGSIEDTLLAPFQMPADSSPA
ncbi:DUF6039 family protein [Streptomyces sp. NPDC048441]|uniref:DUF6039 family protein n=1 Tax=Streptomyces sp. NPDC048441 TaxID=3365552 RepID=UPI00371BC63C